jgi:hypothetical protein
VLSHKAFTISLAALACSAGLRGTDSSTPLSEVSSTSGLAVFCPPLGTGDGDARGASPGQVAGSSSSNSSSGSIRGPSSWPAALSGTAAYGPGDCLAGCTSSATSRFRRAISAGRSMTSTGSTSSSVSVGHGSGAERPSAPLARATEAALCTLAVGWGPGAPELANAAATPPAQQSSTTRPCPPAIAFFHGTPCASLSSWCGITNQRSQTAWACWQNSGIDHSGMRESPPKIVELWGARDGTTKVVRQRAVPVVAE